MSYLSKQETKIVQVFIKHEDKELELLGQKKIQLYHRFKDKAIILGDGRQVELFDGKWIYLVK